MLIFKKILLDITLIILLLIFTPFIAAIIATLNPSCYTCGAQIAITLWLISISALQPVVWASDIGKIYRFLIWLVSFSLGVVSYLILELVATQMFLSGNAFGLNLGFYKNITSLFVALIVSLLGIHIVKKNMRTETNYSFESLSTNN